MPPVLKVMHIISGDLWAGAESMAGTLLRRLREMAELDLCVVLLNQGRLAEELRREGIRVEIAEESALSFAPLTAIVRRLARHYRPHVIHSHRSKENLLALLAGWDLGAALVATQHGLPEIPADRRTPMQQAKVALNFRLLSRFFMTVAVSAEMRDVLVARFGFRPEGVKLIHNGIDLPAAAPPRRRRNTFVIGSSGRLFSVKDFPLMVETAGVVAGRTGCVSFELAGEGPERGVIERLVRERGLGRAFALKGHLDDMNHFYRGIDMFLNTSVHEGIPMTILEALGHGVPVVAPAVGGIPEVITDGTDGFLVNTRSARDFADRCLLLKADPAKRAAMARAARRKAESSFSAEAMGRSYFLLYSRLAGHRGMTPGQSEATQWH